MHRAVIEHIQQQLTELLGKRVLLSEPDWQSFVDFPAVYLEFADQNIIKGINQYAVREMLIDVFIIDRCLPNDVERTYLDILDVVTRVDKYMMQNRSQQVNGRSLMVTVEKVKVQANRKATETFALIGAGIRLKVIFEMEV